MSIPSYRTYSDNAAENYERYFVPTIATAVAGELLAQAGLQPGERVLDLACGTGLVTRSAAAAVGPTGRVVGVDVSPDMLAIAGAASPPDIEWRQADAVGLPLDDASVDVVLCQLSLQFFEDPLASLSEACRVLTPGGRIVVNTPGRIQPVFEGMAAALADHADPGLAGFVHAVFSLPDPSVVAQMLADAGFTGTSSRGYEAALVLPEPGEFFLQYVHLTPMAPMIDALPEETRTAMQDQMRAASAPWVEGGATRLRQPMALAWGQRPV